MHMPEPASRNPAWHSVVRWRPGEQRSFVIESIGLTRVTGASLGGSSVQPAPPCRYLETMPGPALPMGGRERMRDTFPGPGFFGQRIKRAALRRR